MKEEHVGYWVGLHKKLSHDQEQPKTQSICAPLTQLCLSDNEDHPDQFL